MITRNRMGEPTCTTLADVEIVMLDAETDRDRVYANLLPKEEGDPSDWNLAEVVDNLQGENVLYIGGPDMTMDQIKSILREANIDVV